ncbi:MAG: hypothetical protein IJ466_09075 [Clostridia bacterium]|nr:hypothetical protein [Clostridia bacterium]
MMKQISFAKGKWNREDFILAFPFRLRDTSAFIQEEDCVSGGANPEHSEGFDNFSLLTRETYGPGVRACTHSMFEKRGCTEIIFVPEISRGESGEKRYGACFEIVIYKGGVNVWRHYYDEGKCSWHKRLGMEFPLDENEAHTLAAEVQPHYLVFTLDGKKTILRTDDFPERFHLGITCCEGAARIYDLSIETGVPSTVPVEGGLE